MLANGTRALRAEGDPYYGSRGEGKIRTGKKGVISPKKKIEY